LLAIDTLGLLLIEILYKEVFTDVCFAEIRKIYIVISIIIDMDTTIAIKENTLQILSNLKEKMKARSVEDVIIKILQKSGNISKTRFGSNSKLKKFQEKERANAHEL